MEISSEHVAKQREWDDISSRVEKIRDGMDEPIDSGIKETVIAFNALGFKTAQSCEGHLERAVAAPWMDIGLGNISDEEERTPKAQEKILREAARMMGLLEEFYASRSVSYDRRLIIKPYVGRFRMESAGTFLQDIADENSKRQKLGEYQNEMKDFTGFLKDKYFSQK